MKISTSTGDFSHYVGTIAEKVRCFKGLRFKYINLEQTGTSEYCEDSDEGWKKIAKDFQMLLSMQALNTLYHTLPV